MLMVETLIGHDGIRKSRLDHNEAFLSDVLFQHFRFRATSTFYEA